MGDKQLAGGLLSPLERMGESLVGIPPLMAPVTFAQAELAAIACFCMMCHLHASVMELVVSVSLFVGCAGTRWDENCGRGGP